MLPDAWLIPKGLVSGSLTRRQCLTVSERSFFLMLLIRSEGVTAGPSALSVDDSGGCCQLWKVAGFQPLKHTIPAAQQSNYQVLIVLIYREITFLGRRQ